MPRHERPNPETDPYRPPAIPTEVCCLHCGQEYESYLIHWQEEVDERGEVHGFWCCPTTGCDGRGFGFDIFPTDPEYRDEDGEPMWFHDDEDGAFDFEWEDEDGDQNGDQERADTLLEAFDADDFLAAGGPFDLDLPPPPTDTPPPLELDLNSDLHSDQDAGSHGGEFREGRGPDEADWFERGRRRDGRDGEDDIPY